MVVPNDSEAGFVVEAAPNPVKAVEAGVEPKPVKPVEAAVAEGYKNSIF